VDVRRVAVRPEVLKRQLPLKISFHIETPRSPAQLKWSDDSRLLGFQLTQFQMGPQLTLLGKVQTRVRRLWSKVSRGAKADEVGRRCAAGGR